MLVDEEVPTGELGEPDLSRRLSLPLHGVVLRDDIAAASHDQNRDV